MNTTNVTDKCGKLTVHSRVLTHCVIVVPYGDTDLDQLWISYTGLLPDDTMPLLELSINGSLTISQDVFELFIRKMSLKITL